MIIQALFSRKYRSAMRRLQVRKIITPFLAGRASGSQIQDVSVIGSSVALSGTDCGGFIGEGKKRDDQSRVQRCGYDR